MGEGPSRSPLWLGTILILVLAELIWRLTSKRGYDMRGALATLGLAAGNVPAALLQALVVGSLFGLVWRHAPLHYSLHSIWTWITGFLVVEFAYYWFHRASHRLRWLWTSHSVHHSAEQLTLLSSLRLSWTNVLSAGWVVYLPVVFLGFDPRLVAALLALDLHYQFFLHTEVRFSLGPLEWILNSPAHHRVHHGVNDWCLDRNYGGMLIVFDRLFGTFAAERAGEPIRYGLVNRPPEFNPIKLALREWIGLFKDLRRADCIRSAVATFLLPP